MFSSKRSADNKHEDITKIYEHAKEPEQAAGE